MIAFLASAFGLWFFNAPGWAYILLLVIFIRSGDGGY